MTYSRRGFLCGAGAALCAGASWPLPSRAAAAAPAVVLVHGEFVDAGIWNEVIPRLTSARLTAATMSPRFQSAREDAARLESVLASASGDVVLVGHSYGGALISAISAAAARRVRALVFVAGLAPDEGETFEELMNRFPRLPSARDVVTGKGGLVLARDRFAADCAADVDPSLANALADTQPPMSPGLMSEPAPPPSWKWLPAWYVVSSEDRLLPAAAQAYCASRMRARVSTLPASHLAPLSHPLEIARVIVQAANEKPGERTSQPL